MPKTLSLLLSLSLLTTLSYSLPPLQNGKNVPSLKTYNVDIYKTSVSGLSSGGFFAVQMHVAYSSVMVGAGIFAGGPYHCSEGNLNTALNDCMDTKKEPNIPPLVALTNDRVKSGVVDDTVNLGGGRVFLFSGVDDDTVNQPVMNGLRDYYENFIDKTQIVYENSLKAAHTQPTDDKVNKNACDNSSPPYISYCNYDGSGEALNQIYGTLNPRNNGELSGSLIEYNQSEFIAHGQGMSSSGWMYVPQSCASGESCILHISFHGCKQNYNAVGSDWIENTGYNKWADTNNMIILFPQTEKSYHPYNPYGCWDWWGYNNPDNFDTKNGVQMNAVWEMILRITGGFLSPPSSLTASDITNQTINLSWEPSPSSGVAYNLYRNGTKINTTPISGLEYEDKDLIPGLYYSYVVVSVDSSSQQSGPSNVLVVQTLGEPPSLFPPENLASPQVTAFFVLLTWDPVCEATSYNIYRNGVLLSSSPTTTYNDTTVLPLTTYSYQLSSVDEQNQEESFLSSPLQVSTPGSWKCVDIRSSNYQHVQQNRAYQKLGNAYAVGSNDFMGLDNVAVYTTLAEVKEGYWVVGSC